LVALDRALLIVPENAHVHHAKGVTLEAMKKFDDALGCYAAAIRIKPDFADAYWNLSLLYLLMGDYRRGLQLYEWRLKKDDLKHNYPVFAQPRWSGFMAEGKTLLVYGEQGFGDVIQFARYLPLLVDKGAKVVLLVPKSLFSLMSTFRTPITLISKFDEIPDFDEHCPMMSLPLAFATTLETIPKAVPYLGANPEKVGAWREVLAGMSVVKVGLVWSGGFRQAQREKWGLNETRNIPLSLLSHYLQSSSVQFIGLQKGEPAESEIRGFERDYWPKGNFLNVSAEIQDFSDTAAIIQNLDLVITVDTAVAHLSGALGKPTWILNRFDTCWRWMIDRDDSPWYPTARVFRQDGSRDWEPVLRRVQRELGEWVETAVDARSRRGMLLG
jgi:tetratricopeptide (TPR) repeat protein